MDDYQDGVGVETWPDGSIYSGSYAFGKKNGKGKFYWPDKSVYEGEFKNNNVEGEGKYD